MLAKYMYLIWYPKHSIYTNMTHSTIHNTCISSPALTAHALLPSPLTHTPSPRDICLPSRTLPRSLSLPPSHLRILPPFILSKAPGSPPADASDPLNNHWQTEMPWAMDHDQCRGPMKYSLGFIRLKERVVPTGCSAISEYPL